MISQNFARKRDYGPGVVIIPSKPLAVLAVGSLALTGCGAGRTANATPVADRQSTAFTHLTAENGAVHYDMAKDEGHGTYTEPDTPYVFHLGFKQGERNSPHPVLVSTISTTSAEHFRGKQALQFQIVDHQEPGTAAYKADLAMANNTDSFAAGAVQPNDRYLGFAMKIDPSYYKLPPTGDVIFSQWHQGSPMHPVVTLSLIPPADAAARGWSASPTGHYALVIRDDDHNAMESTPGKALYYDLGPVDTGHWNTWVVYVRAGLKTNGIVTVWENGKQLVSVRDQRVGYDPANPQYGKTPPTPVFDFVSLTLYRMHGLNHQRLFFDEGKFADTFSAAAPNR